ncbi:hypothetical protein [Streptosporangium roseum]|uniref:Uncharacterized protein n=1 Tax=Streptosporangium roseum (strain ATCC 12428 / DSM 43021 / JCM 3005 / KCTC 9067 / NCIMB 10171 / NRRL 2505 / NI 9100) TaxID=479432 RepID=D2BEL3_STRRD|nr:hypothetical protein [Streptosporangium roseum]ACZ84376.1 hypothetical protein Sros_1381 [Streptosporangium roseum DSM 43021]
MGVAVINLEAGRLREPAAWLMTAIAFTSVLVGVERLLFGGSSTGGSSFGLRAAGYVDDFTSPVTVVLAVGAVLLASHLGPVIARLKVMVYVAVATLGLAALFGVVGLFGGLFSGDLDFGRKIEFFLVGLPSLALAVVALLYLLPKAAPAASRPAGFRADGGFDRPQEQYVSPGHASQGGPAYSQGGQAPQQGFQSQDQMSQQGFQPQDQAFQGGQAYPQGGQAPQQGFQPQDQAPQQGFPSQEQSPQQGFQPQDQMSQQGFQPQDQAPQQGFQPQEQSPQGGHAYSQGGHSQQAQPAPAPQQGFPSQDQAFQGGGQTYSQGGQAPQQGFQSQEQSPQGGHAYSQGGHSQQAQPAPAPQLPYSQPALPPAPSSASSDNYGASDSYSASDNYGASDNNYGRQQAHGYAQPVGDGYSQAAYAPPAENQPYGNQAASYAPAQPAPQALPPAAPAEPYTPSPYVAADVQPPAPARPYEPPVTAYDPPIYATPAEQQPQSPPYAEPQHPGYGSPAEPQHSGYGQQADAQFPGYAPQSEPQQAPFYQAQPEAYQAQPEAPAPYTPADAQPRVSFDSQAQSSFPQPPENYGQPFGGYSGTDFARPTEPNLHYPAPDPVDPRSQQMAQAYQQAESYQQQSQGGEPQLRVPEYGASQAGGSYDDPFGHPQTPQAPPAAQPYQQQGGHQWDTPAADATLRFDPSAYQGDPLNDPNAGRNSWDSQPAIDPTAIYKPERSAQVTGEEIPDRERVGPGQEQNMSWYGSDRREH